MKCKLLLLLLLLAQQVSAQDLISTEQGLSNRWTTCVAQDKAGMMWIGTINGLNRYDGYAIKQYFTPQISNNNITCLIKSRSGLLWAGTTNGLNIINPETGTIKQILNKEINKPLVVHAVFERNNGEIIISDQNGIIYTIINQTLLVPVLKTPEVKTATSEMLSAVNYIREDEYNVLWLINDLGFIYRYDGKKLEVKSVSLNNKTTDYPQSLHVSGKDTLLVGSIYSGLYFYDFNKKKSYTTPFIDSVNAISLRLFSTFKQSPGNYWLSYSDQHIRNIDIIKRKILTNEYIIPDGLSYTRIHQIYSSREKTLWLCTDQGVWKIKRLNTWLNNHLANADKDDYKRIMNAYSMRALLPINKELMYVSTYKGFLLYNPLAKKILSRTLFADTPAIRSAPFIRQMIRSGDSIWCATEDGNLLIYDRVKKKFSCSPVQYAPPKMPVHNFYSILKKGGNIWCGTPNGIYIYNIAKEKFTAFDPEHLSSISIYQINNMPDEKIALSTSSGLYVVNNSGIIKHFNSSVLPSNEVNCSLTDGNFIFAGTSNGLCRINALNGTIKTYTVAEGLCNNYINCIQKGIDGALWLSTNYGLSRFDPAHETFVNFYTKNGLCENEFNRWSYASTTDGLLYFGTINGMISFNPMAHHTSDVTFTEVFVSSISRHSGADNTISSSAFFHEDTTLNLSVKDNYIEFSLGLTSFTDVENNRYYYRLIGNNKQDTQWTVNGTQNKVRLTNMQSGRFVLQLKGINSEGHQSTNIIAVPLFIHEVYYKTWWFISIVLSIFFSILFLVYKLRVRQLMKLQHIRTKIASDLHDEVGGVLTRISIQSELLKRNSIDDKTNHEQLSRIAENSKHAVDMMSDVLWSIDARSDSLQNMTDRMRDFMTALDDKNIAHNLIVSAADMNMELNSDKRQHVYLIFKECITNIIKHSIADKVEVCLTTKGRNMLLTVRDNGKTSATLKSTGQGLRNMQMRSNKLNGKLTINTESGFYIKLETTV